MIFITVVLAIFVTLFVGVQDPIIQKFAVRFAGGYLSEKTGADIKVGRLAVTPDFQVYVDGVEVKDLRGNDLAKIERLRAKIFVGELLEGKIHLGRVALRNTEANLIQYEGEEEFNFQFLADFFSSGEEEEKEESSKPLALQIDNININNLSFVMWDQNDDKPELTEQNVIDYSHLDLDSIYLSLKDLQIMGDSIHTVIEMLKAKEISGFEVKMLQSDVIVAQSGIRLTDMQLETNNSLIHADLNMLYNNFGAFQNFVDSVRFDATIYPTDVMLSDIGAFSDIMYQMPDRVFFEGRFTGPIAHFKVNDINAQIGKNTSFQGDLSMHPLDFENGEHELNIKKLRFTYDDIVNFYIPGSSGTVPLPESLSALNSGSVRLNFKGSYNNFKSDIHLLSDVGNVDVNVSRNKLGNGDNIFSGDIKADRVDAGVMANASKFVGKLDLNADFSAKFPKNSDLDLTVDGKAYHAQLLGNHIDEVILNGDMKDNRFEGRVSVDDDDLGLDFDGLIDFKNKKYPKADFSAVISHADLSALKLLKNDSISAISTRIVANLTGFDIDDLEGELHLDSTTYRDSRGSYFMNHFDASIVNDNLMQRRINLNSDFFNFELAGKINFAGLVGTLNEYGDSFVHFPIFEKPLAEFKKYKRKHDVEQDFVVSLTLKDTRTISRLFMPSLKIAKNTSVNGTFTSRTNQLNLTARSKSVKIGDLSINNVEIKNFNTRRASFGSLSVGEVAWTKMSATDTVSYGLDNILLTARMGNDTITTRIAWDDASEDDHNKALVESAFHPHEGGGILIIKEGNLCVNDSVWTIAPDNFVDLTDGHVTISNLQFSHNEQLLRADGMVPMAESDTLGVQLRKFDLSNFDILFLDKGFDLNGFISGDASLSGLKDNTMLLADLVIDGLGMNGETIGDAVINSSWDNPNKAVELNVNIIDPLRRVNALNVYGSYYTARKTDNLDFNIELDSLRLNVLSPLLAGVVTRMQGYADGWVTVTGSMQKPALDGQLQVIGGGCKVDYLNTFYTFSPTIRMDSEEITLDDLVLVDTLGNKAIVEGKITHDHLKDFNLDLRLHPRQFLALATNAKDNDTFYGTAIANGLVDVKGPFNDIYLGIKARTQKGTKVTIPISRSTTVKDYDFIVFVQKPVVVEDEEEEHPQEEEKQKRNLTLNLDVDVTDEAQLHIDLPNIGNLDATGSGNVKMANSNTTPFSLIGEYIIKSGRFQLNYKNLIERKFDLKNGGTIVFTGDPTDGRINATGAYSVKAGLASLGVEIDSTSSSSTSVNVECLIHLKDALLNPTITFGMHLPNASEDITQTVFSLIDTTNQAVMTEQALSLLVFGTFSYAGSSANNNTDYLDALTSSLLFSGMNLNVTDNLNVGLRYHSGSATSTYDEYQIALRTELFDNRLTIETNVGMISDANNNSGNASNLIGEFDIYYKLTQDGWLQAHFYNHSNYNTNYSSFSFDRLAPYTQGLGLSYSRSFNRFSDLWRKRKTVTPSGGPLINKPNKGKEKQ